MLSGISLNKIKLVWDADMKYLYRILIHCCYLSFHLLFCKYHFIFCVKLAHNGFWLVLKNIFSLAPGWTEVHPYLSWLVFKCSFIYVLLGLVFYCWIIPNFFLFITPFRIIEHCIKKRLQWNTSFARKVCKEGEYYEDMMRYLRRNLAVRAKECFSNFFYFTLYDLFVMFLEFFFIWSVILVSQW